MPDTVIQVENLSKQYRLGTVGTGTLAHDLNRWWCKLRGKPDPYLEVTQANDRTKGPQPSAFSDHPSDYVWALRDINFEVKQGEVLGIIGANGAGKSTLLKILSRVTAPTQGIVRAKGRIASLLEVGTGFHPELTGRENIFLNGAIMGMTRAEVAGKLDEIIDFSGCELYIDTPVKRYSSGMMVRLGFAVAAHLEPEILIVDEVLAVGDAEFQRKCLGKMKDVAEGGRTVLFVSHNMAAVRSLCSRAMVLEKGRLVSNGAVRQVVDTYLSQGNDMILRQEWNSPEEAPGDSLVRIRSVRMTYDGMDAGRALFTTTPAEVSYEFWNLERQSTNISTCLRTTDDRIIFNVWSEVKEIERGVYGGVMRIPGDFLNDGVFHIDFMVVVNSVIHACVNPALRFEVVDGEREGTWFGKVQGAVRPVFLSFPLERSGQEC
jgi:lipopolysaccharide transport system ATP-binding protein